MKAIIDHKPEIDQYHVYLGTESAALSLVPQPTSSHITRLEPGEERPVFVSLSREQYIAIRDAIIEREAHHLGQNELLRENLALERELTHRLLTLVEKGWE